MNAQTEDWLPRHRLNVDEYYLMAEAGVLAPDARVELINGEIIDMTPPGSRHAGIVGYLTRALSAAAGSSTLVFVQSPLRLNRYTEPQPDLMLLHPRADFYSKAHPGPNDAVLAIEVSDSSLRYDRQIKLPLYAAHGIPEFWLIDPVAKELTRCRHPQGGVYADVAVIAPTQPSEPMTTLTGLSVELQRLFELDD